MKHYSVLNRKQIATIFSVIIFYFTGTTHAAGAEEPKETSGQGDAIGSAAGSTPYQGNSQRLSSGSTGGSSSSSTGESSSGGSTGSSPGSGSLGGTPDSSTGTTGDSYGGSTGDKSRGSGSSSSRGSKDY